jgi:hypothetical protein
VPVKLDDRSIGKLLRQGRSARRFASCGQGVEAFSPALQTELDKSRQEVPPNNQPSPACRFALAGVRLAASLPCRHALLPARDMPSSLGRNSEQNDTNRGNPPKAISVRMHYISAGLLLPATQFQQVA